MGKSFREIWGFQEDKVKKYGLNETQVLQSLEGEAKKDFEAALAGVPDAKRSWASLQAGYHLAAEFWRLHENDTSKKIDSGTYMQLKQQILLNDSLK